MEVHITVEGMGKSSWEYFSAFTGIVTARWKCHEGILWAIVKIVREVDDTKGGRSVGGVAEWLTRSERGTVMGFWSTNYLVGNTVVELLGGFLLFHFTNRYNGHYGVRYAFFGCTLVAFDIWRLIYYRQRFKPEDVGLDC